MARPSIPWLAALAFAAALPAAARDKPEGYTCCNLHFKGDWISDANWHNQPMIPAGAKIRVLDYGWNRASVDIDGKPFRLGHDYGRREESLEQWVAKIVVKHNPRAKIEKYPARVKAAIAEGRVIPGMTREQVLIAVGHPPTHQTPTLSATVWNHWASNAGRYEVHWKGDHVDRLVGAPR